MSALIEALRRKYKTPEAALAALGLDAALLSQDDVEEKMRLLSRRTATAIAAALKSSGKLAMDVDPEVVAEILEHIDGEDTEPNAGMPPWLTAYRDDDDEDEFETEQERLRDEEEAERRRALDRRLGRRATDEEFEREEEEREFKPDDDRANDRKRIRADDARRRLGRDETEEECERREREEEEEDRRNARDRVRHARDYRHAKDRHRDAMDRLRRHADDWKRHADDRKRADDACRSAEGAEKVDDVRRYSDDRKRADDRMRRAAQDARKAYDEMCAARDVRRHARDVRRLLGRDNPLPFKGMPEPGGRMVTKEAMDAAIERRIAENDAKHRGIAEAVETVRAKVGRIAMDSAVQSESDVYGRALDILGVPHAGITQLAALKQMFAMAPRPGDSQGKPGMTFDAAPKADAYKGFREMFGDQAANIQQM